MKKVAYSKLGSAGWHRWT